MSGERVVCAAVSPQLFIRRVATLRPRGFSIMDLLGRVWEGCRTMTITSAESNPNMELLAW